MKLFLRVGEGATVKVTIPRSWHAQPVRRLLALAVATHNTRGGAPLAEDAAHLSRDGVDLGLDEVLGDVLRGRDTVPSTECQLAPKSAGL